MILACTELPLLMAGYQAPVPLLDSTRLLAHAALCYRVQAEQHLEGKYLTAGAVGYVQKSPLA